MNDYEKDLVRLALKNIAEIRLLLETLVMTDEEKAEFLALIEERKSNAKSLSNRK